MTSPSWLSELRRKARAATAGPWRSMHDGNQYVDDENGEDGLMLVAASRIEELARAHNPYAEKAFGAKPGVTRFRNDDAQFIAAVNPAVLLWLLDQLQEANDEHVDPFTDDSGTKNDDDACDWRSRYFSGPSGDNTKWVRDERGPAETETPG